MKPERLAAFSDGVLAIIITIMVLELKVPHGANFADLQPLLPIFLSYALSFAFVAIYWNNHHHLLHSCKAVNGAIMWANMNLLFWLSLTPFATNWLGENHNAAAPNALYGIVLLMPALAYKILQEAIIRHKPNAGALADALTSDIKGIASPIIYLAAIGFAFVQPIVSQALWVLVALIWIVPDVRIARALK